MQANTLRLLLVFFCYSQTAYSQSTGVESSDTLTVLSDDELWIKNTTKWAIYLPGSGQIRNKKYWKYPIVIGALATSVWFISYNSNQMNLFKDNWRYETDGDPLTVSELTDSNGNLFLTSDLEEGTYFYRRNRDVSYLSLFGVYLLQIIDANVDAHMKFFDATEDLSLSIIPPSLLFGRITSPFQVGLTWNISSLK